MIQELILNSRNGYATAFALVVIFKGRVLNFCQREAARGHTLWPAGGHIVEEKAGGARGSASLAICLQELHARWACIAALLEAAVLEGVASACSDAS